MTLLLTAGTGKTSLRAASLLTSPSPSSTAPAPSYINAPFLLTSRRTPTDPFADHYVKFDFLDSSTYGNAWSQPTTSTTADSNDAPIKAIYLVAPETQDPSRSMIDFVDYAIDKGVKRFVMLTGLTAKKGGPHVGGVWAHLDSLKESKGVRYAVLRCTWFMENFSEREHVKSITESNTIYTCTSTTRIPFISATDIARVALTLMTIDDANFDSLLDDPATETAGSNGDNDLVILGSTSLNHDEAASTLSKSLSRSIVHRPLSAEELSTYLTDALSMPAPRAKFMAWLQSSTEDAPTSSLRKMSEVERVTGVKPIEFAEWVNDNKGAWS